MSRKRNKRTESGQAEWSLNLEVVHPNAAGIDIGNETHYVAVAPSRDPNPVRQFACFTEDLRRLADWLKSCGIDTVAMQSTGVYWLPVYEILAEKGLEVYLVNARHTKNLPGRKSDVQECQWMLQLHTFGLLNNSFRPPEEICVLRAYWRQRGEHVAAAGACIQRMQKVHLRGEDRNHGREHDHSLSHGASSQSAEQSSRGVRAVGLLGTRCHPDASGLESIRQPGLRLERFASCARKQFSAFGNTLKLRSGPMRMDGPWMTFRRCYTVPARRAQPFPACRHNYDRRAKMTASTRPCFWPRKRGIFPEGA
jgi:hypothetical protein